MNPIVLVSGFDQTKYGVKEQQTSCLVLPHVTNTHLKGCVITLHLASGSPVIINCEDEALAKAEFVKINEAICDFWKDQLGK